MSFFVGKELIPNLLEKQEQLQTNIIETQNKISKRSINSMKKQIASVQKEVLKQSELLEQEKSDINFVMGNIYKLKNTKFNEKVWANILDSLLKKSTENSLKIISMKSNDNVDETTNIVKAKKSLQIEGIGDFKNVADFINYIGTLDSLIVIKSSALSLDKSMVKFKVDLDTYGVGL